MLFLRNIREIEWATQDGISGCYLRQEHPDGVARRVILIGETQTHGNDEQEWLVFETPVVADGSNGNLRVEIAFQLTTSGQSALQIIAPHDGAVVCVFFPTEKRTNLGFLIQGPYRTTPARDNVPKDDAWNRSLIEKTAALVGRTLPVLRDMRLLTPDAFHALPIQQADFLPESMFCPIFEVVADTLKAEILIPTDTNAFARARSVRLSRSAELRKLFPPDRLTALVSSGEPIEWVVGDITQDRTVTLYAYFRQILGIEEVSPEDVVRYLTAEFLLCQSDDWLGSFFVFLEGQEALWRKPRWPGDTPGPIRALPIIRLEDGSHIQPFRPDGTPAAYISAPVEESGIPYVKRSLVENDRACSFLKKLGMGEFDILAELRIIRLPKYQRVGTVVPADENIEDVRFIIRALRVNTPIKKESIWAAVREVPFVWGRNVSTGQESYRKGGEVYIRSDELDLYFSGNKNAWFLDIRYPQDLLPGLEEMGVSQTIRMHEPTRRRDWKGNLHLEGYPYRRGMNGFDPAFDVDELRFALEHPTLDRSRYVWNNIAIPHAHKVRGVIQESTRTDFRFAGDIATFSEMGKTLTGFNWLPLHTSFVRSTAISLDELPEGFVRDETLAARLQMKLNEVAALARKVGVEMEDIRLLQELKADPEQYEQVRQWIQARTQKPDFPVRSSQNPDRRSLHVGQDIKAAPNKSYETKPLSQRVSSPNQDKTTWLRESYTNSAGQMICQICEKEMPFKKRDGQYYFEAVELLNTLPYEYHAFYLALCPVCAAKYKEFVKHDPEASTLLKGALSAAKTPLVPLSLGEEAASLRFVETHFIDVRVLLEEYVDG
jgi:hypothetical protein